MSDRRSLAFSACHTPLFGERGEGRVRVAARGRAWPRNPLGIGEVASTLASSPPARLHIVVLVTDPLALSTSPLSTHNPESSAKTGPSETSSGSFTHADVLVHLTDLCHTLM